MRIPIILSLLLLSACKESEVNVQADSSVSCSQATAHHTPSSVVGNDNRSDYPLSNTIDGNLGTFMQTTSLSLGDVKYIAYGFSSAVDISTIEACDLYTYNYNLGDLVVLTSNNSTNGVDGTWSTVATQSASTNLFSTGRASITANLTGITWIKFEMTYNGSGAYGGSPSFYLSEIAFRP